MKSKKVRMLEAKKEELKRAVKNETDLVVQCNLASELVKIDKEIKNTIRRNTEARLKREAMRDLGLKMTPYGWE